MTGLLRVCVFVGALAGMTGAGYGQISSTAPLSGVISDPSGAVIPGASITVRNSATSAQFETISIENGTFVVPALTPGVYTVTVSLRGFKQAVVPDVRLDAGTPASVRVVLQVGDVTESVTVEDGAEILQTQTATVSTTIDVRQVMSLPVSRNALDFTTLLPGVSQSGNERTSRVNGLSRNAVNITIDGINTQEYNKDTDYFSFITPRADAIEEVTISTAAPGAESSGQGGVHVKMVTRQGSNEFHGSLYEFHRNSALNANAWFTNRDLPADPATGKAPRNRQILNQYGFRLGGPIVRNRAFFFINLEESRQPTAVTRNRTIMNTLTQQGVFQYNVGSTVQQVDMLTLAARQGQTSTIDSGIGTLLGDIRKATQTTGGILQLTDPNLQRFTFQNKAASVNRFPTLRLDFNLTQKHHLETSYWYQRYNSLPDTLNNSDATFPGFPQVGSQNSDRFVYSAALRSTLTSSLVNEARFGFTGGSVRFSPERNIGNYLGPVANTGGYHLNFSSATTALSNANISLQNPHSGTGVSRRNTPVTSFTDTLNWQKSAHSLSFGGNFTESKSFVYARTVAPAITFGVDSNDPANALFTTANFPGASNADLNRARAFYAVLTGRVAQIAGSATIDEKSGEYVYLGSDIERGRQREWGFFAQDSWRARPNLTLNYGLRYELQFPYRALNARYTWTTLDELYGISGPGNLFRPGVMTGRLTGMSQLKPGESLYETDLSNFAPSFGAAWSPQWQNLWLKRIFGEKSVLRAGYSIAYIRRSNSLFNDGFDQNPGGVLTLNRNATNGNLVSGQGADRLPLLFRETQRLGAPAFSKTPAFPLRTYAVTDDVRIFHPNFKVPYVQSWTLAVQRELNNDTSVEIRYVGNRSLQNSETVDLNEVNIVENGFMEEFKLAMANLQANASAGRGSTFRYAGPGTGTSPLPALLGYLAGSRNASDPAAYPAAAFTNATLINRLAVTNPAPYTLAQDLYNDSTRRANASRAGLPPNFFHVNPDLDDIEVIRNGGYTNYNAVVVELRRRLSKGLLLNSSYTFSKTQASRYESLRRPRINSLSTTTGAANAAPHVPHVFKTNWVYELPVGNGRFLLRNAAGVLDRIAGGWEISGTARIQNGDPDVINDVRLIGMTRKELQKQLKIRFDDANRVVYALPQDVIDNTVRANNVSATNPGGYSAQGAPTGRYIAPVNSAGCIETYDGDCGGMNLILRGPKVIVFDLSATKTIRIREKVNFEFRAEMFNAFNNTNFDIPDNFGTITTTFGQVTGTDGGARTIQLIGRINF